jgi:hypothetical protein
MRARRVLNQPAREPEHPAPAVQAEHEPATIDGRDGAHEMEPRTLFNKSKNQGRNHQRQGNPHAATRLALVEAHMALAILCVLVVVVAG